MKNISIGSDPELMIFDNVQNKIVSSIPILEHNKHNPIKLGDGINLYSDNVLAEVSFPPAYSKEEIIFRIKDVFKRVKNHLGKKYKLIANAAHEYDMDELACNEAWEAGCDPSYNVYTGDPNPISGFSSPLRTGSAHIHIGHEKLLNPNTRNKAIRLMDIFVGCSSVLFDKDNSAQRRRELYGRASEHRITTYGFEYRCLGPYILRSPELIDLALDLSIHSMSIIEQGKEDNIINQIDENQVISAINDYNIKLATDILKNIGLPERFFDRINSIPKVEDLYQTWDLA